MDLAALVAIDVHVHVEKDGHGCHALDQELLDASAKYFRADQDRTPTLASIAEHYRARRTAAVVFTVDAPTGTGHPPLSSEEIAEQACSSWVTPRTPCRPPAQRDSTSPWPTCTCSTARSVPTTGATTTACSRPTRRPRFDGSGGRSGSRSG